MRINWKIRKENITFWVRVLVGFAIPILAAFGMDWSSLTSWSIVGQTLLQAISNPYVLVLGLIGAFNAFVDPTTPGISDSTYALNKAKLKG